MSIERLPSGSYRVTQIKNGVRYRKTFDHRPTKKEADEAIFKQMIASGENPNGSLTFAQAAQLYVEMKRNVLSPSTLRDYVRYPDRLPRWFADFEIDKMSQIQINKVVNELALKKAPKTILNYHVFMSAVLGTFRPEMKIYTTLPKKAKNEPYTPSDEDVRRILAELEGTKFYVPVCLACFGFRRSEILGLQPSDIDGDRVYIHRAKVLDEHRNLVEKSTKTVAGTRYVKIPMKIADMIRAQGFVYDGAPNSIVVKLEAVEKKLGIPKFSLHKLRHYFASATEGMATQSTRKKLGGWETDEVMNYIYTHSSKAEYEQAMESVRDKLEAIIF